MLAAAVMFFANLGAHPLFNPDESLYAEPAREMLDTGEYITTLLNYAVRFTKPPLVIWAMALSYNIFGVCEFAARFFEAACGLALIGCTYFFVEKYASRTAAFIAAFSLLTAPLFVGTAREAITDMPLSLFIAGALMAFFHGFQEKSGRFRWLGYALVGLAVMTKGPVGLVLPLGIIFCFHLWRGELTTAWRYYKPVGGLALVAAISLPWFCTEIYLTKGAYYQEFLVRENFQRFTSVVDHKGAWWYHIAAVAGGYFPWTVFAPQALLAALRPGLSFRADQSSGSQAADQSRFIFFCALSFVIVLSFFSISISKLLPYTLPGFPFLAALVGVYLGNALARTTPGAAPTRIAVPLALLAAATGLALYLVPHLIVRLREMPPELPTVIHQALVRLLVAALAALGALVFKRPRLGLTVFAAAVFVSFLTSGSKALEILSAEWEGPVPAFAKFAALSGDPIVVWHMRKPSITFYAGRKVLIPADATQLDETMKGLPRAYVIAKVADLPALAHLPDCRLLVKQGRFALLRRQADTSP